MKTVKLPIVSFGKCVKCNVVAEYYFGDYGSNESCIYCNASASSISAVVLTDVSL